MSTSAFIAGLAAVVVAWVLLALWLQGQLMAALQPLAIY